MTGKLADALASVRKVPLELHALMVLCTAMGLLAGPTVDSIRDVYQAYAIATGSQWPLQGPQLAHSIHLGPVWFYLLSIPALFGDNLHTISVFVFALSGLKFYLAWYFGKQMHSPALGLAFALMLALPSWSSAQLIIWTHTSVLETALLAYLILLRAAILHARNSSWLYLGIGYSLAIHAHPTAAPFGWLMVFAASKLGRRPKLVLWFLFGVTIPLIPYFVSQSLSGFPDLSGLGKYGAAEFHPGGLSAFARLIYSVIVVGPNLFYQTALPENLAAVFIAIHWTVIITGLAGFLASLKRMPSMLKRLLIIALANFVIVSLFVILIRGRTPWHLAYAPSLAADFIYAIFWTALLQYAPRARLVLAPIVVLAYGSVIWGASTRMESASLRLQEKVFYDVKNIESEWGPPGLIIPARHANAHGEFLCREPVALHGPYAAAIDGHLGMEAAFTCGRRDAIVLGGTDPAYTHWVGVSEPIEAALGAPPKLRIGNVSLYTPLAIGGSGRALSLPQGDRNPPRQLFRAESREMETVSLESASPSALLISKPVGNVLALEIENVLCNGQPAERSVETNYAWLYSCSDATPGNSRAWRAQYTASAPGIVDSVLLPVSR